MIGLTKVELIKLEDIVFNYLNTEDILLDNRLSKFHDKLRGICTDISLERKGWRDIDIDVKRAINFSEEDMQIIKDALKHFNLDKLEEWKFI